VDCSRDATGEVVSFSLHPDNVNTASFENGDADLFPFSHVAAHGFANE